MEVQEGQPSKSKLKSPDSMEAGVLVHGGVRRTAMDKCERKTAHSNEAALLAPRSLQHQRGFGKITIVKKRAKP